MDQLKPAGRRYDSTYPGLRSAAAAARPGADGSLHTRMAPDWPEQALLRRPPASALRDRDCTRCVDRGRDASFDTRIRDDRGPAFPSVPGWIAARPLPAPNLAALVQRAVPVLKSIEKVIHPRWPTAFHLSGAPHATADLAQST
jgi:Exopolysaccharide synthesis, ExoD